MGGPYAAKGARHERTFRGCKTCRNRHVKCDETRPSCGPCRQFGLECGGYWSPLLWIHQGSTSQTKGPRGFEFRYPLLSETQRQRMSIEISSSLGRRSAADVLDRLDVSCEKKERQGQVIEGLVKGPFGAFSSTVGHGEADPSSPRVPNVDIDASDSSPSAQGLEVNLNIADLAGESWPDWEYDAKAPDQEAILPSFNSVHELADWIPSSEPLFDHSFDSLMNISTEDLPVPLDDSWHDLPEKEQGSVAGNPPTSTDSLRCQPGTNAAMSLVGADLIPADTPILPPHSESLLRHYRQQIFEGNFLQAKGASPWQTIFFPSALETFAELSIWRHTTQTRYAILHGLLALSAFRLHSQNKLGTGSKSWHQLGCQYQKSAQIHLYSALATEMTSLSQTKYKELLMAILAVSMISLTRADESFKVFLLDAERLICRQGLSNDIPMDSRLLHHMYSYLRVISESTGVRLQAPTDDPMSDLNEPPLKGGRFCLATECYSVGLDSEEVKRPDIAYTDIHLQIQGQWQKSLYPIVYGIPEVLWTLLGQTAATTREKARLESLNPPDVGLNNAMKRHIQELERAIWAWTPTAHMIGPKRSDKLGSPGDTDLLDNPEAKLLAQGLHQTIVVYFYREVFHISPMIMQSTVEKALDYLAPCIARIHDQDLTPCISWAVSTAAREAIYPEVWAKAQAMFSSLEEQGIFVTNMPFTHASADTERQQEQQGFFGEPGVVLTLNT